MLFSNITLAVATLSLGARAAVFPPTLSPIRGPAQPVFPPINNPIKGPAQPLQLSARGIPSSTDSSILSNNPALGQETVAWANSTMEMWNKVVAACGDTPVNKKNTEKRNAGDVILDVLKNAGEALGDAFVTLVGGDELI